MAALDLEDLLHRYFPFGFQTSRDSWDRFGVGGLLAQADPFGEENVRYTVRRLVEAYNERPPSPRHPATPVHAEQLLCLGMVNDALRYILLHYALREKPGILREGLARVRDRLGEERIDRLPGTFAELFPPRSVLVDGQDVTTWLQQGEPELPAAERVTAEAILLYLMMRNPATRPLRDLFDDHELQRRAGYVPFVVGLEEYLDGQEPSSLTGQTLFHALRAPMLASPDDLAGQLAYIRQHWAHALPGSLARRLDLVQDLLAEMDLARAPEYGPPPVLEFGGEDWLHAEPAAFSRDADWMSNVVLMAKSTYVWLDQLSRRHGRAIVTLADIPDEELDRLARWGVTSLWLIGVWARSDASRKIKQYAGNPDAVASAYSLDDYEISDDLGGWPAYQDLRERAWQRGIRLASDMVPNHMGIDSRWVIQHPDWFLQAPRPPYPGYSFTGGDLCDHPEVEVRIEEGYWHRTDAAVVFERKDARTGETRYIYHGNDGTSMPWNDTAQLDFTNPEVREAVIRTILHVARHFPVIRFDAAMTLARKHYQRLWFPAPGDAGAIPSRAEYGLTREEFLQAIPKEFWREVVDRVAAEVPDTLLLAEAFWLMEGYFVRTLGMHRVYNSAFMNMLKMEENQKYRRTVQNVLEFSPAVLQRFVNFMNNPDERTAVEQFGKGDKYFGVAILMVTMPGLPMLGHGQVEGFAEKYGMEYKRAYWDEPVDEDMVRRHEREVFPLMRRRALFSGAENFALFDFRTPDGQVDENVYAYTNRHGGERALILYNNAYTATRGHIHTSTPVNAAAADADPHLVRRSLTEALALDASPDVFHGFRDFVSGLEYLRRGSELADGGLFADLHGYQAQAFLDWHQLPDPDGRWATLHARLDGRGVPSLRRARRELDLEPLLARLAAVNTPTAWADLIAGKTSELAEAWSEVLATARQHAVAETPRPRPETPTADLAAALARVAATAVPPAADAAAAASRGPDAAGEEAPDTAAELDDRRGPATGPDRAAGTTPPDRTPRPDAPETPTAGHEAAGRDAARAAGASAADGGREAAGPPDCHPDGPASAPGAAPEPLPHALAVTYAAWQFEQLAAALGAAVPPEPGDEDRTPPAGAFRLDADDLTLLRERMRQGLDAQPVAASDPDTVLDVADLLPRHRDLLHPRPRRALRRLFTDRTAQRVLHANRHEGTWYFGKERFEALLAGAAAALPVLADVPAAAATATAADLAGLAAATGYRHEVLLARLASRETASTGKGNGVS